MSTSTDFQRTTPFLAQAPNNVDPGTPWSTPFPDGFLEPLAGAQGLLTGIGTGFTIPNPEFEVPYTDQWMAGVDVQLPWNIGLDVAYVGNKVSKLGVSRPINECAQIRERQTHPKHGRQRELSERDVREPVCRIGARPVVERGHGLARRSLAAVHAVRRASR